MKEILRKCNEVKIIVVDPIYQYFASAKFLAESYPNTIIVTEQGKGCLELKKQLGDANKTKQVIEINSIQFDPKNSSWIEFFLPLQHKTNIEIYISNVETSLNVFFLVLSRFYNNSVVFIYPTCMPVFDSWTEMAQRLKVRKYYLRITPTKFLKTLVKLKFKLSFITKFLRFSLLLSLQFKIKFCNPHKPILLYYSDIDLDMHRNWYKCFIKFKSIKVKPFQAIYAKSSEKNSHPGYTKIISIFPDFPEPNSLQSLIQSTIILLNFANSKKRSDELTKVIVKLHPRLKSTYNYEEIAKMLEKFSCDILYIDEIFGEDLASSSNIIIGQSSSILWWAQYLYPKPEIFSVDLGNHYYSSCFKNSKSIQTLKLT